MMVAVTLPSSVAVRVSVQVAPTVAPPEGRCGKKLRNDDKICAVNCAGAVVSVAAALRNAPDVLSRPAIDRPLAAERLRPGGKVEPESGTMESTVTVVA